MKLAFLTTSGLDGFVTDDDLAVPPLSDLGIELEFVEWRRPTPWDRFDAVVIRSTWDYMLDPHAFLTGLDGIDGSPARLLNTRALVEWNLDKTYLRDLAGRGVEVVPSRFGHGLRAADVARAFDQLGADDLVVKPTIGASALDTVRVSRDTLEAQAASLEATFVDRGFLIQPFLESIVERGEVSLFYFDGALSHAILKRPAPSDFRVQEEFGASIESLRPTAAMRRAGARALAWVDGSPLYARVDLAPDARGFLLMELELIEPSLYLRTDDQAPGRFARAVHRRLCTDASTPHHRSARGGIRGRGA